MAVHHTNTILVNSRRDVSFEACSYWFCNAVHCKLLFCVMYFTRDHLKFCFKVLKPNLALACLRSRCVKAQDCLGQCIKRTQYRLILVLTSHLRHIYIDFAMPSTENCFFLYYVIYQRTFEIPYQVIETISKPCMGTSKVCYGTQLLGTQRK